MTAVVAKLDAQARAASEEAWAADTESLVLRAQHAVNTCPTVTDGGIAVSPHELYFGVAPAGPVAVFGIEPLPLQHGGDRRRW